MAARMAEQRVARLAVQLAHSKAAEMVEHLVDWMAVHWELKWVVMKVDLSVVWKVVRMVALTVAKWAVL